MQAVFCLDNTRLNPSDRRIQGNVTLSCSKSRLKNVSRILYGFRGRANVMRQCVQVERLVGGNKVKYVDSTAPGSFSSYVKDAKEFYSDVHELNLNELGLVNKGDGFWEFEKGAKCTFNINWELPSSSSLYLPSSYKDFGTKSPYYGELTIRYELVILVHRTSTVFKRLKVDTFKKEINYQSRAQNGTYNGNANEYHKYIGQKKYKIRLWVGNNSSIHIPLSLQLNTQKVVYLNKQLFDQINIHFYVDFSNVLLHTELSANGIHNIDLGVFKIKSLELYILYSSCLYCKGDEFQIDQNPIKLYTFEFKDLTVSLNNFHYDHESKTGSLRLSNDLIIKHGGNSSELLNLIRDPVMCSCDTDGLLKNKSSLKFVWLIEGPNNTMKFSFYTESTLDFAP